LADDERTPDPPDHAGQSRIEPGTSDGFAGAIDDEDAVLVASQQTWSGPLPPPTLLVEYNDAVANGAERVLSMAEAQARHRMKMEEKTLESDRRLAQTGQWIGLVVVLAVLALGGYMAHLGATTAAVATIGIDVVGLAAVFVFGSLRKRVIHEVHVEDDDLLVG
jgi:uncharacterized membrane protein